MIRKDFIDVKFIVMVRDPRDAFSSYKSITSFVKGGGYSPSFGVGVSLFEFLFDDPQKSYLSYMKYFQNSDDSIRFVRYEDLVKNTRDEMCKVADFLELNYSDTMIEPTTAGRVWGGNSSNNKEFIKVEDSRINEWPRILDNNEVCIIEHVLSEYLKQFNYEISNRCVSKLNYVCSIRLSHFGVPILSFKDFLRPYVRIIGFVKKSLYQVLNFLSSL